MSTTRNAIASTLCLNDWPLVAKRIIPPWIEGCQEHEMKIKDIWQQVQTVLKQRDELIELRRDKAAEYRSQCNELILTLATQTQELLEPGNA